MLKIIGGVIAGIFIGSFSLEIISQTRPDLIKNVEQKAERIGKDLKDAFLEGYHGES